MLFFRVVFNLKTMFPLLQKTLALATIVATVIVQVAARTAGAGSDNVLQDIYDFVIGL